MTRHFFNNGLHSTCSNVTRNQMILICGTSPSVVLDVVDYCVTTMSQGKKAYFGVWPTIQLLERFVNCSWYLCIKAQHFTVVEIKQLNSSARYCDILEQWKHKMLTRFFDFDHI